jgi:3D-(3,5/4)-trihydroxycyclohexane-1,2-dione acylhydrolase (decyclizing)
MAFDCPVAFLQPAPIRLRRPAPDAGELARSRGPAAPGKAAADRGRWRRAVQPGQRRAGAVCRRHGIPVAETQAGKSSLPWDHPLQTSARSASPGRRPPMRWLREADLVLAVGTRLQDFTTGSNSLFTQARLLGLNVQPWTPPRTPTQHWWPMPGRAGPAVAAARRLAGGRRLDRARTHAGPAMECARSTN